MTERPTDAVRPGVLGLAALFVVATAGVAYSGVGRLSPTEPFDPDYLWRPWPLLDEHEALVGATSVGTFVITGAALAAARRQGRMTWSFAAQVAVVAGFAAWLGVGYQVVTAGVTGANIGGGLVLLVTPVLGVLAIALVVGLALRGSRRRDEHAAAHIPGPSVGA